MKVSLAAEVLSTSVADALQYLQGVDEKFKDAGATIDFIRRVCFICWKNVKSSRKSNIKQEGLSLLTVITCVGSKVYIIDEIILLLTVSSVVDTWLNETDWYKYSAYLTNW